MTKSGKFDDKDYLQHLGLGSEGGQSLKQPTDSFGWQDDGSAPSGDQTVFLVFLSDEVLIRATIRYPDNLFLREYAKRIGELYKPFQQEEFPTQSDFQIFNDFFAGKSVQLKELQPLLLGISSELQNDNGKELNGLSFSPMFRFKTDGRGGIYKKDGIKQKKGSFAAVLVNEYLQFTKIPFVLRLNRGWQKNPIGACKKKEHRTELRNFRFDGRPIPLLTYEDAQKKLRDFRNKKKIEYVEKWVVGDELKKMLSGKPDPASDHTVRGIIFRVTSTALEKGVMKKYGELLLVTERGDQRPNGKPPAIGFPGGMVDSNETFFDALVRESQNEAQIREVQGVVALMAEVTSVLPGKPKPCVTHWFWIEVDSEAGMSRKLVESDEIYRVDWFPLSSLAGFSIQNANRPVMDPRVVFEKKLMYFSHARTGAKLLSTASRRDYLTLPDNWPVFESKT